MDRFKFRVWEEGVGFYNTLSLEDMLEIGIVEQCTGLKDKNGKLIYEGDILKWLGYTGKVHWKIFRWCFDKDSLTQATVMSGEIIGNIHENPSS